MAVSKLTCGIDLDYRRRTEGWTWAGRPIFATVTAHRPLTARTTFQQWTAPCPAAAASSPRCCSPPSSRPPGGLARSGSASTAPCTCRASASPRRARGRRPRDRADGLRAQRDPSPAPRLEREARGDLCGADRARAGLPDRDGRARRRCAGRAAWQGDLVLKGYGDPSLSAHDLAVLARRGAGRRDRPRHRTRVGDETWFDARRTGRRLEAVLLSRGVAAALGAHRRPGPRRARDLARSGARRGAALPRGARPGRRARRRAGAGRARRPRTPCRWPRVESPTVAALVRFMDRESDNFTAEMLLKEVGAVQGEAGTTAEGLGVVAGLLTEAGVPLTRRPARRRLGALAPRPLDARGARRRSCARCGTTPACAPSCSPRSRSPAARARSPTGCAAARRAASSARRPARPTNASALSGFVGDRYVFSVVQNGRPVSRAAVPARAGPLRDRARVDSSASSPSRRAEVLLGEERDAGLLGLRELRGARLLADDDARRLRGDGVR